jgi:hypothetical protein
MTPRYVCGCCGRVFEDERRLEIHQYHWGHREVRE